MQSGDHPVRVGHCEITGDSGVTSTSMKKISKLALRTETLRTLASQQLAQAVGAVPPGTNDCPYSAGAPSCTGCPSLNASCPSVHVSCRPTCEAGDCTLVTF